MKKLLLALLLGTGLVGHALADGCVLNTFQQKQDIQTWAGTGAASSITLTAPANPGQRFSVTGIEIYGLGATAGSTIHVTLAGLNSAGASGTETFAVVVPAGVTTAITPLTYPIASNGVACPLTGLAGTAVVLTVPSFGSGNTFSAAALHGFYSN